MRAVCSGMKQLKHTWTGIDYGSKLAGTTALTVVTQDGLLSVEQSAKKQDADRFLQERIQFWNPRHIFIDAPLSLPGVYSRSSAGSDYFYRQADRELKAMSPMFLGGLTARAIRLKDLLEKEGRQVLEVYPGQLARFLEFQKEAYKKDKKTLPRLLEQIQEQLPYSIPSGQYTNWHRLDSLLAFLSGYRYLQDLHQSFGDPAEGCIIF
jgi:predicted nuclease with RNAse H fold